MIANFTNFLSNMDKNSQFLLIIIFIIVFLLFLIFIINSVNSRKTKKYIEAKNAYRRKLREEIDLEAKNIVNQNVKSSPKKVVEEEIEILDDKDEIDEIIDDLKVSNNVSSFDLTEFEREQEETAIISYHELCMKHGVQEKKYTKEAKNIIEKVNDIVENRIDDHKYKPSKYVSPIFGLQQEEAAEQTFLTSLKEFRNGLE